jgi:hypothetical protein
MTIKEFGIWLEAYYGPYTSAVQRIEAIEYLRDRSPAFLDALKKTMVMNYSSVYGKTPDVAIFEKYREEAAAKIETPRFQRIEAPEEQPVTIDGAAVMREIMTKARKAAQESGKRLPDIKKSGKTIASEPKK